MYEFYSDMVAEYGTEWARHMIILSNANIYVKQVDVGEDVWHINHVVGIRGGVLTYFIGY